MLKIFRKIILGDIMENKNSLWNKFISTGKVQDYLAYSQKKEDLNEKGSKEIKEDTNKRNSDKNY